MPPPAADDDVLLTAVDDDVFIVAGQLQHHLSSVLVSDLNGTINAALASAFEQDPVAAGAEEDEEEEDGGSLNADGSGSVEAAGSAPAAMGPLIFGGIAVGIKKPIKRGRGALDMAEGQQEVYAWCTHVAVVCGVGGAGQVGRQPQQAVLLLTEAGQPHSFSASALKGLKKGEAGLHVTGTHTIPFRAAMQLWKPVLTALMSVLLPLFSCVVRSRLGLRPGSGL